MQCTICVKTVKENRIISCPSCEYKSCSTCLKKYFLGISEPRCPNCLVVLTREFVRENFKMFSREYEKMRERFIFQQEIALMPSTLSFVENELKARELLKQNVSLYEQKSKLYLQIEDINSTIRSNAVLIQTLQNHANHIIPKKNTKIIGKCPTEECRGFVTETEYKCGVCSVEMCKKCLQSEINPHKCNQDDVATAKLLQRDSKACPTCATLICKIDGCDQMWCTQCHTSFSWITGLISNGRVHNPHFYEWQRSVGNGVAPRVEDEVRCGHVDCGEMTRKIPPDMCPYVTQKLMALHMFVGHFSDKFPEPAAINNINARVKYLLNEMTEKEFMKSAYVADKDYNKRKDIRNIVDVLVFESDNIFRDVVNSEDISKDFLKNIENRMDNLVDFINTTLVVVHKKYGVTCQKRILYNNRQNYNKRCVYQYSVNL